MKHNKLKETRLQTDPNWKSASCRDLSPKRCSYLQAAVQLHESLDATTKAGGKKMPSPFVVSPAPGVRQYYRVGTMMQDDRNCWFKVVGFHSKHGGLKIVPCTHEEIEHYKHVMRTTE